MTPRQAITQLQDLPETVDDIVILRSKQLKAKRTEKDSVISFRIPNSLRDAVWTLLDRITAKIGSQSRADQLDWLVALGNQELDGED